jgi:hypothetical protein
MTLCTALEILVAAAVAESPNLSGTYMRVPDPERKTQLLSESMEQRSQPREL